MRIQIAIKIFADCICRKCGITQTSPKPIEVMFDKDDPIKAVSQVQYMLGTNQKVNGFDYRPDGWSSITSTINDRTELFIICDKCTEKRNQLRMIEARGNNMGSSWGESSMYEDHLERENKSLKQQNAELIIAIMQIKAAVDVGQGEALLEINEILKRFEISDGNGNDE